MNNLSRVKHLYAYENGDNVTPRMGVQIATGHGLQQFYNAENWEVTNTDLSQYPATLFPQPYSGKAGAVVVPSAGGQWYLNAITDNNGILDSNGAVKSAFSDRFQVTTVTQNNKTFPGLIIKDNLVNNTNRISSDIYIYYVGTYGGKQFVCDVCIPVQSVIGNAYQLLVSVMGADGSSDEVLSDDNDYVEYSASLQLMSTGTPITGAVITFEHATENGFESVQHVSGMTEISNYTSGGSVIGKVLKVYPGAVDGQELFRAKAVYNGKTYYKTMEPTDEHDPYYIDDGCSIAGDTVDSDDTVTWSPKVYKRHNGVGEEDEDVTSSEGWSFVFTLIRQDTGAVVTEINHTGITYTNLKTYGGLAVRINANRS